MTFPLLRRFPAAVGVPLRRTADRRSFTALCAVLAFAWVLTAGCSDDAVSPEVEEPYLGPSLALTFEDPILLTMAATRSRTRYLEDEGYTLARDSDGVVAFVTDTAGDLGVSVRVDGSWLVSSRDYFDDVTIHHALADGVVWDATVAYGLKLEARFVVATSRVAALELVLRNARPTRAEVDLLVWLRRCGDGRYADPLDTQGGVRMTHGVEVDFMQEVVGPGTYLEDLADILVAPERTPTWVSLPTCDASVEADVLRLATDPPPRESRAAMLALPLSVTVPAGGALPVRVLRGVVDVERAPELDLELEEASLRSPAELLRGGQARVDALPTVPGLGANAALVARSSFVLLQQLMMPAEGNLLHDYYLFSREPTWWFARLGQHVHESLAMILMAHSDPEAAMGSHRIFMERVGINGYVPYNIGPVVEQTALGTASAPLFSYVAWEIAEVTGDASFLADAYVAGSAIHDFWRNQRDEDQDGLAEWGGYGITESVRDLENVIWVNVASPEEVEAIGLNAMLVKDASVLGQMADALGLEGEGDQWRALAEERAALINTFLWDEVTGFYYHVARDTNTFDYAAPNDLKRMEIAGFLPLWAGAVPPERVQRLLNHLTDRNRFWRPFGVPGLAATDPYYDPEASQCCRWRGPVWVQWQWLIMRALLEHDQPELAVQLTRRVLSAVQSQLQQVHQFRELYDPDEATAPNRSMPNYIWSAMVTLMMMETAHLADPPYGQ